MVGLFRGFLRSRKISTTFDTYNHEAASITSPGGLSGLRYEISKTVLPFLQVSTVGPSSRQEKSQYFATLSTNNSVFQFSSDSSRNYQFKSSFVTGPFVHKIHSIVSSRKEVFSQMESMYNSPFYSIGLKLVSPAFEASNLIYIVSCWRSLGRLCLGAEAVGMKNQLGVSFSTRLENEDSVYCLNVQRFNLITLNFYKRLLGIFEVGAEVKKSRDFFSTAAGLRVKSLKSEVKCTIDQKLRMTMGWNERLTESLSVSFGWEYGLEGFDYGVGINYESYKLFPWAKIVDFCIFHAHGIQG